MDKNQIDLLALISRDTTVKKVASTNGGEYHAPCVFCGGDDRMVIQPNAREGARWSCRQCTPHWQDCIAYVMRRDNCDFKAAVATLGLPLDRQPRRPAQKRVITPDMPQSVHEYAAFNPDWQQKAHDFMANSYDMLRHAAYGGKAWSYLINRGIEPGVIDDYGLGFNPEDKRDTWGDVEVFLPRGIVIPWGIDRQIWKINIRRPTGDPKYLQAAGGANGLYNVDAIKAWSTVVMVEGEFDALVLKSHAKGVTPVATGTTSGARILRWVTALMMADVIVVAYDADELTNEGVQKAVQWWMDNLGDKAVRLMPPAHDVTDAWKEGHDLQAWLDKYSLWIPGDLDESTHEQVRNDMEAMGYRRMK